MIVFEHEGLPVELHSERDRRAAIAAGRLRPETLVQVYGSSAVVSRRADQVDELKPLFGVAPEPQPAARPASDRPTTSVPTAPPRAPARSDPLGGVPKTAATRPAAYVPPLATSAPSPIAPPSPSPARPWRFLGAGAGFWLAIAALLALTILVSNAGWKARTPAPAGGTSAATAPPPATASDVPEPAADAASDAPAQTRYVTRDAALYATAADDRTIGSIARGTAVVGNAVDDASVGLARRFRIGDGPSAGAFVDLRELAADPPPPLDDTAAGERATTSAADVRAAPDPAAPVLQANLAAGTMLSIVGSVAGDWYEVALRDGGVGYVAADSFTPRQGALTDPAPASSSPPSSPPPSPPPSPSAMSDRATRFVERSFDTWSADRDTAMRFLRGAYAPVATFYGTSMPAEQIMAAKARFVERWPSRRYTIEPGSLQVSCDPERAGCTVTGTVAYECRSPLRAPSSGVASFEDDLDLSGDAPVIRSERGRVLRHD